MSILNILFRSSFAVAAQSGGGKSKSAVAFYASLSHDIHSFHDNQILCYDKVWLNYGNGFNGTNGMFYPPVDGMYSFYIKTQVRENCELQLDIVRSDNLKKVSVYAHGESNYQGSGAGQLVVHLTRGQTVWVRAPRAANANNLMGNHWNIFTGFLIQEM